MITSLSKLTMRRYIELVCGDTSVLTGRGEVVAPAKLQEVRKQLMFDYYRLSDDAGSKVLLSDHAAKVKAKAELTLFQCLNNAIALRAFDDVRQILKEYGIARTMDDNQVAAEVTRLLNRAKTNVKRFEKEEETDSKEVPTCEEIHTQFDSQVASLMTYFKFQIDLDIISAAQFACLINQAHKQIKAQMDALKKK